MALHNIHSLTHSPTHAHTHTHTHTRTHSLTHSLTHSFFPIISFSIHNFVFLSNLWDIWRMTLPTCSLYQYERNILEFIILCRHLCFWLKFKLILLLIITTGSDTRFTDLQRSSPHALYICNIYSFMIYHTWGQHANHYTTDVLRYECIHSCDIFRFSKEVCSIEKLQKEFDILKSTIESMNATAVMSHNDLLLKNIIYDKATGTIDNS